MAAQRSRWLHRQDALLLEEPTMIRWTALLLVSGLATLPTRADERVLTLDPEATTINFHLGATGHDVDGLFKLVAGELRFDPVSGVARGEIRIDATKAATGNKKRDREMHDHVLETGPYPLFLFHADRIEGQLAESGTSDLQLHGTVSIHGADHPLTLPARVTIVGDHVSATTSFPVPFVAWGMKDPSWFVLRVEKEVGVTVKAEGRVTAGAAVHAGSAE
jgi:polyisoprenoid-binding protein YceI